MLSLLRDLLDVWDWVVGFIAGMLSFWTFLRIKRTRLVLKIRIWCIKIKRNSECNLANKNRRKRLDTLFQKYKLYSSDAVQQRTAIAHLTQIGGKEAVQILAQRLAAKPELDPPVRDYLIDKFEKLARELSRAHQAD